ncbi:hypothetical protein LIER_22520 [Lithospermum erythrorhizon]|uniref:EF-hand domain-containing protein n=1 Tax=Lithospermum erythrorhizon TaxID=34254 RepID=A0AAV3QVF9_LITER
MSMNLQDMSEVEKVFQRFDTKGDGKISADELSAMHFLGSTTSSDEVSRMMEELGSNKDGFINLQEFGDFCRENTGNKVMEVLDRELKKAFEMFDEDGDGAMIVRR